METHARLCAIGGKPEARMPIAASFDLPDLTCILLIYLTCILHQPFRGGVTSGAMFEKCKLQFIKGWRKKGHEI